MKSKMKKKKIQMGHAAGTRPSARSSSIGVDQLGTLEDGSRRSHNVFCSVHVRETCTEKFMEEFCKKVFQIVLSSAADEN